MSEKRASSSGPQTMKELIFLLHHQQLTDSPQLLIGLVCKSVACGVWPKDSREWEHTLLISKTETNTEDCSLGSEKWGQNEAESNLINATSLLSYLKKQN